MLSALSHALHGRICKVIHLGPVTVNFQRFERIWLEIENLLRYYPHQNMHNNIPTTNDISPAAGFFRPAPLREVV